MGKDNEAGFAITADPAALQKGMNDAVQAVEAGTKKMQAQFEQASSAIQQRWTQSFAQITAVTDQVDAKFKAIGDTFKKVQGVFIAFTAVLAGGAAFKEVIDAAVNWNSEVTKLAKSMGISTEKASGLAVAMKHLGIDSDTMVNAASKLSKQMGSNEQAFEKLGVQVKNSATGAYRPLADVMVEVNTKLMNIHNTAQQNIAGQQIYGKSWQEVRAVLKLTAEEMQNGEKRAKELGLMVGEEAKAKTRQYKEETNDLGLVTKALAINVGNVLLPVMVKLGKWFIDVGVPAVQAMTHPMQALSAYSDVIAERFRHMGDTIANVMSAVSAYAHLDFQRMELLANDQVRMNKESAARITEIWKNAYADKAKAASEKPGENEKPAIDFGKDKADKSRMGDWENEVANAKLSFAKIQEAKGTFYEYSKEKETEYWKAIIARHDLSREERLGAERKYVELSLAIKKQHFEAEIGSLKTQEEAAKTSMAKRIELARQEAALIAQGYGEQSKEYEAAQRHILEVQRAAVQQQREIENIRAQAVEKGKLAEVDATQRAAQLDYDLGRINKMQLLEVERQAAEQRYQIERQALDQRLALLALDPTMNPVEYEKVKAQILDVERQHQMQIGAILNKEAVAAAEPSKHIFDEIGAQFSKLTQGMATRSQQMRQMILSAVNGVGNVIIAELITKPLQKKLAAWSVEMGLADAEIGTNAAKAASGAASAEAGIPIVGPVLALAAMGAMFAAVMGMKGNVKSASGGYSVPAGLNPMTQLHAEEMVLPRAEANAVRDMAGNGGGGPSVVYNDHSGRLTPQDIERNAETIVKVLKAQGRKFAY